MRKHLCTHAKIHAKIRAYSCVRMYVCVNVRMLRKCRQGRPRVMMRDNHVSRYAFIVYRRAGVDAQLASHVLMDNGLLRGYKCAGRQPGITRLLTVPGNEYTSRAFTCRHACTPSGDIQGRVHPRNTHVLSMRVYVYICISTCLHIRVHVYVNVFVCVRMCTCTYVRRVIKN